MQLTDKQIAANQSNAQKSTGPRTPEGKRASSQNAISHGMFADGVVLPGESKETFLTLIRSLHAEYLPQTPSENMLVETMAVSRWRILRLWALEARSIAHQKESDAANGFPGQNPTGAPMTQCTQTALTVGNLTKPPSSLESLSRFEARFDRQYHRAADRLQRRQTARMKNIKNAGNEPTLPNDLNDLADTDPLEPSQTNPERSLNEPITNPDQNDPSTTPENPCNAN